MGLVHGLRSVVRSLYLRWNDILYDWPGYTGCGPEFSLYNWSGNPNNTSILIPTIDILRGLTNRLVSPTLVHKRSAHSWYRLQTEREVTVE